MLTEFLQDRATLYASGEMPGAEREQFELLLEFHEELRNFTAGVSEASTALVVAAAGRNLVCASPEAKKRICDLVAQRPQQRSPEAVVVGGPNGLVEWVNAEFTAMCGYSLDELRGKKLGPILQGPGTDRATATRMREAVQEKHACRETILNYHKDGTAYWVEIEITPVLDEAGAAMWFLARERGVADPVAA
jgi:PAS domain S-box-containing protein